MTDAQKGIANRLRDDLREIRKEIDQLQTELEGGEKRMHSAKSIGQARESVNDALFYLKRATENG